MRNCPVCDLDQKLGDPHCNSCGWFFRIKPAGRYRNLLDIQLSTWKSIWQQQQEKTVQINPINDRELQVDQKQFQLNEVLVDLALKKQALLNNVEQLNSIITSYEQISQQIDQIHEQQNYLDALFKPYAVPKIDCRLNCSIKKTGAVEVDPLPIEYQPDLLLVLGKRPLFEMVDKAEYFIRLNRFSKLEGSDKWTCQIPNVLLLKGRYYGYLSTLHLPEYRQIKVNTTGAQINFN